MACQIAGWLVSANSQLPPNTQFQNHHIQAVLETVREESRFEPCVISRHGDEGLFQVRDSRRKALHAQTGVGWRNCVPAEAQIRFMVAELRNRPEAQRFFAAKDYKMARAAFVHGYEGR